MGSKIEIVVERPVKNDLSNAIYAYFTEIIRKHMKKLEKEKKDLEESIINDDKHELNDYYQKLATILKEREKFDKQINEIKKEMRNKKYYVEFGSKLPSIKTFKSRAIEYLHNFYTQEIKEIDKEIKNLSVAENKIMDMIKFSDTDEIALKKLEEIGIKVEVLQQNFDLQSNPLDSIQHLL